MLSNLSKLQVQIDNKVYQLLCDVDSPLPSVKEALFQFQKFVGKVEDDVKAQQEKALEEAKAKESSQDLPVEESKPVENVS